MVHDMRIIILTFFIYDILSLSFTVNLQKKPETVFIQRKYDSILKWHND